MAKRIGFRIDFDSKVIGLNEKERIAYFALTPKPERYEVKVVKGQTYYYDKFDNLYIPEEVLEEYFEQVKRRLIFTSSPKIKATGLYIESRIPEIRKFMEQQTTEYEFEDKSEGFLNSLSRDKLRFVILSIDLKDSTQMSEDLSPQDYAKLLASF